MSFLRRPGRATLLLAFALVCCLVAASILLGAGSPAKIREGALSAVTVSAQATEKVTGRTTQRLRLFLHPQPASPTDSATPTPSNMLGTNDFDDLMERADQGNVAAACRLSALLALCTSPLREEQLMSSMISAAAETEAKSSEEQRVTLNIIRLARSAELKARLCKYASKAHLDQTTRRTLQAARLGVASAAVRFFLDAELRMPSGDLDRQMSDIYRNEALLLLGRAARSGNAEALLWFFWVNASGGEYPVRDSILSVSPNPIVAVAAGRVLLRVVDPWVASEMVGQINELSARLTLEESMAARHQEATFRNPVYRQDLMNWNPPDEPVYDCDRG